MLSKARWKLLNEEDELSSEKATAWADTLFTVCMYVYIYFVTQSNIVEYMHLHHVYMK